MIEITVFILLNILGLFMSLIMILVKIVPEEDKNVTGWGGLAFIFSIISLIIWLCLAVISALGNIGYTESYGVVIAGVLTTGSIDVVFDLMWPFALIYVLISIPYFFLLLYLMPETWKSKPSE